MAAAVDPSLFKETLIVLGSAAVVIPIFHRIKVSPILGFILVGMLVGPFGLGALAVYAPWLGALTITDVKSIAPLAELGIALLLFMIGLELSFQRLMVMRRLVLGLGGLQLVVSAALIGAAAVAFGLDLAGAIVMGLALAMSSTAIVVQVLAQQKRLSGPVGKPTFAVLLFQDLAVAPVLFAVAMLGARGEGSAVSAFGVALAQAAIAIVVLVVAGRLLLRPLFRQVARTHSPELFLAACLLVILSAALATGAAGLSMAMGALLAGLLLAETEYRRQIEVLIEPFKGLLLGVFLISVGMTIDLTLAMRAPAAILAGAVALVAVKAAVVVAAGRLVFGVPLAKALRAGLLLGPGGEFAFVILGGAVASGLMAADVGAFGLMLAALTMALIPLLADLADRLAARLPRPPEAAPDPSLALSQSGTESAGAVVIAGFGRVGEVVADLLEVHAKPFLIIDRDPDVVARARRRGRDAYLGDLSQPAMLRAVVREARALVVTMDSPVAVDAVVAAARAERADLLIVARSRDARHASRLYQLGASDAVPETVEASLQLSEAVLLDIGTPAGPVIASIHDRRAAFQREIRGGVEEAPRADVFKGRRRAKVDEGGKG